MGVSKEGGTITAGAWNRIRTPASIASIASKGQASPSFGFHPFSFRSLSFAGDTFARTFTDGTEEGKFSSTGTPAGFATVVGFFSPSTSSSAMTAPDVTGDPLDNGFLGTVGLPFHPMDGDASPSPAESMTPHAGFTFPAVEQPSFAGAYATGKTTGFSLAVPAEGGIQTHAGTADQEKECG